MKTIYYPLTEKDPETGLFYQVFQIPDEMAAPAGYMEIAPPEGMKYARWDFLTNKRWYSDPDSIIADLTAENKELLERIDMNESALLDLADMVLTR